MPATITLGINGKLMITVSGGQGGTFVECTGASDVNLSLSKDEGDATTRAGGGYKQTAGTLKSIELKFKMRVDYADTQYVLMRNNFLDAATYPVGFKVLDKVSGEGPKFDGEVMSMERDEGNSAVQMMSFTVKVGWSATAPSWVAGS